MSRKSGDRNNATNDDTQQSTQYQPAELKHILTKLRPFQREAYEFATQGIISPRLAGQDSLTDYDPELLGKGRICLCDEMGLGKTVTSLAIMAHYRQDWPLLILAPASLKHTWADEIEKFMPSIPPRSIYVCSGFNDIAFKDRRDVQVVVVTYSLLQERSAVSKLLQSNEVHFQAIICDESHNLKQKNSQRSKIALPILQRAKRLLLLSGTPALARPAELWLQLHALAPQLFGSWSSFTKTYCDAKRKFGRWDFSGLSNAKELHAKLKQVMVRRLKCDVLHELPAKQRMVVPVKITDKARIKENKEIIQDMNEARLSVAELVGGDQHEANFEAKQLFNRAYQASGIAKAQAVADFMVDWIVGAGTQKLLVFAHHKAVMDVLELALSKHLKGVGHIRIDGSVPSNERANLVRKFQTSPQVRVGLLSMTAAGVGLTLTAASTILFAELHYTPGVLAQAEDRAHRIGQRNAVNIMYFVCKDEEVSTDMAIWKMLGRKVGNLEQIIDGGTGREKAALAATELEDQENKPRQSGQEELADFFAETTNLDSHSKGTPKEPAKGSIMSFFQKASDSAASATKAGSASASKRAHTISNSSVSAAKDEVVEWTCSTCTFINSKKRSKYLDCEMCRTLYIEEISLLGGEEVPAVTPRPTLHQKKRPSSALRSPAFSLTESHHKSPFAGQVSLSSKKPKPATNPEVVVIDDEDAHCSFRQTPRSSKQNGPVEMVLLDSDEEDDQEDDFTTTKQDSSSTTAYTSNKTTMKTPSLKSTKSKGEEMLTFSVSKNTSRITIHYKKTGIPSLVNFDVNDIFTGDTIEALMEAKVTRAASQPDPVQLSFNGSAISSLIHQLDPGLVDTRKEREQCCQELQEFVKHFFSLREVEKRAIRESGKALSSRGLHQVVAQILTGQLERTGSSRSSWSTDRYSGGARERAKKQLMAGSASASDVAVLKGENCAWCAGALSDASKSAKAVYCSQECSEAGRLHSGNTRDQVFALENGVCQLCGLEAHALYNRIKSLSPSERVQVLSDNKKFKLPTGSKALHRLMQDPKPGNFWQADHIIAVAEGGGNCGLDNLRTLCVPCHELETDKLRRRLKLIRAVGSDDGGKRKQMDIRSAFTLSISPGNGENKRPRHK